MTGDGTVAPAAVGSEADPPREVSRRRLIGWFAGAVALVGTGGGYWYLANRETAVDDGSAPAGPAATIEVTRETLIATETWTGTLGHGRPFTVSTKAEGTITWLAERGTEIKRGSVLFRVDERPVAALIGKLPMYRDLSPGCTGRDVEQLEANLTELGLDGFDVDETFTWYTGQAVKTWQSDIGADETGTVNESDVVYLTTPGRIGGLKVAVGAAVVPGTEILGITGSEQIVSFEVDVGNRDLVSLDTEVTIGLPGDTEVSGHVISANVVEDTSDDGAGSGGGAEEDPGADDTVTEVEVTLDEQVDQALLGSPVDVIVDVEKRENVLAVPVGALLALSEGGFGLEVVHAQAATPSTDIVAVDVGMFANGKVEVSGEGIEEGTVVGVAEQ